MHANLLHRDTGNKDRLDTDVCDPRHLPVDTERDKARSPGPRAVCAPRVRELRSPGPRTQKALERSGAQLGAHGSTFQECNASLSSMSVCMHRAVHLVDHKLLNLMTASFKATRGPRPQKRQHP